MTTRAWDKEGVYSFAELKRYRFWTVDVSCRQHTLGAFIIFCHREIERIANLSDEELIELRAVMREIEEVLAKTFAPVRVNYWQMGNALKHLHVHGIPRYEQPRTFAGEEWVDASWGTVPTWKKESVDREIVLKVKEEMISKM